MILVKFLKILQVQNFRQKLSADKRNNSINICSFLCISLKFNSGFEKKRGQIKIFWDPAPLCFSSLCTWNWIMVSSSISRADLIIAPTAITCDIPMNVDMICQLLVKYFFGFINLYLLVCNNSPPPFLSHLPARSQACPPKTHFNVRHSELNYHPSSSYCRWSDDKNHPKYKLHNWSAYPPPDVDNGPIYEVCKRHGWLSNQQHHYFLKIWSSTFKIFIF